MTSPWHVLGIARGSSLAEVKKAYARLLRQHRPDQDPVGFRRLRDAYELAVRMAELGVVWPDDEPDAADETDFAPSPDPSPYPSPDADVAQREADADHAEPPGPAFDFVQQPPSWRRPEVTPRVPSTRPRELAAPLQRALARVRAVTHPPRERRLLRLLADLLQQRPHDFAIAELAHAELSRPDGVLRRLLVPEPTWAQWMVDGLPLGRALLLAHLAAGDLARLYAAVDAIERNLEASTEPKVLALASDAARTIALLDPRRAERITDLVFKKAPTGMRSAFGDADAFVQAGLQLRENNLREDLYEHLPNLVLALCDPRIGDDEPRAQRAMQFAVGAARSPEVAALVAERFPTTWPRYAPKWRRNRASKTKRRQQPARRSFGRYLVMIWLVLTVLGAIVRACRDDRPPKFRFERNAPGQWSSSIGLPPDSPR